MSYKLCISSQLVCVDFTLMCVYNHMNKYKLKHMYIFFPHTYSYGYGLGFAFKYTLNPKVCILEQLPAPGMPA